MSSDRRPTGLAVSAALLFLLALVGCGTVAVVRPPASRGGRVAYCLGRSDVDSARVARLWWPLGSSMALHLLQDATACPRATPRSCSPGRARPESASTARRLQIGTRRGGYSDADCYKEVFFNILVHRVFSGTDVSPYLGAGIGVHSISFDGSGPSNEVDGVSLIAAGGVVLFRTQYFRILGGLKGSVLFTDDEGIGSVPAAGFEFGLTSPTVGRGNELGLPSPCVTGCIAGFFLAGLLLALLT